MLLSYGMSLQGQSHKLDGVVCQDAFRKDILGNGWLVLAVADGVGSSRYSDVAAKLAVDSAVDYLLGLKKIKWNDIINYLSRAFEVAFENIEFTSVTNSHDLADYDTTLTVAIYDGKRIAYGHSGDGGIIGLGMDGEYIAVTKPQKGEDGQSVIPLRANDRWEFGLAKSEYAGVLVATDGVYDAFFPYLLKGQECEIYVPLIRFFLDLENHQLSQEVKFGCAKESESELKKIVREFLESDSFKTVLDDITIAVGLNLAIKPLLKEESYYAEPDWLTLKEEWNKKAYPHLYDE